MRRYALLVPFLFLAALAALRIADPWPVAALRETYFDTLQKFSPRPDTDLPVRVVVIDDASLAAYGQWPWPRSRLAELNDRLAALGAAVVVYDFLFAEPDRLSPARLTDDPEVRSALGTDAARLSAIDYDAAFARAVAAVPTVLSIADAGAGGAPPPAPKAGLASVGADPDGRLIPLRSATPVLPALAEAAAGIGVINVDPGARSDVIRSVPLIWGVGSGALPSLSLEALRVALGQSTIVLRGPNKGSGLSEVRIGRIGIPTTPDGLVFLHYRKARAGEFIPAAAVLSGRTDPALQQEIAGSVVFIGASAPGLTDIRTTVLGEQLPGVAIHAQMLEQMLTGSFLTRGDAIGAIEILALISVGAIVLSVMSIAGPIPAFLVGSLAAGATVWASWHAFTRWNLLFDASYPLVGGFAAFSGVALFQFVVTERERRAIRRSFARYVSPQVLGEIDRRGHDFALGGEMREITVMFCDVRNFTPLSETLPAKGLVAMLNTLFNELSGEILDQLGTIDKYIGDEIMAFWNAPVATEAHQRRACAAALGMRVALERFNGRRVAEGLKPIEVAIGLGAGEACVGNIGSSKRFNYTAIGETVNTAARTQTACRRVGCDVLVTEAVAEASAGMAFLPAGAVALKGVSERMAVSVLVGAEEVASSPAFAELAAAHSALVDELARGTCDAGRIDAVKALAIAVEPRLAPVYDALTGRIGDFAAVEEGGG